MRIACLGGGPAGLYFAISMKLRNMQHDIHVFERNRAGDTFGWGVVFSEQTLDNLKNNDPVSAETIIDSFAYWDAIDVVVDGERMTSSGHGFIGIGRKHLLNILQRRAHDLGVKLHFEHEFDAGLQSYTEFDLIVAADGVNSLIRSAHPEKFQAEVQTRANKFTWLGTTKLFDAFAFIFEKTEHGWVWAHAYRFDETHSTFIVECSEQTWSALGFDQMEPEKSVAKCEEIFAAHLDGHRLINNAAHLRGSASWINFKRVLCHSWSFDNVVLLGDAAHTAHFSIGSGTKLALEDAIKLAEVLGTEGLDAPQAMADALRDYQAVRQLEVLKIQNSARNSTEWFETLDRYLDFPLPQFTYSLLTRSQRISHENLRERDSQWLASIEEWFWREAGGRGDVALRPMFSPFNLRGMALANRVAVAPMLTYACEDDGRVGQFHAIHYGARALGGAGLIITEMVAVAPEGRATPACPGLYDDEQIVGWRQIVEFAHRNSNARMCIQLGHAGPRGACQVPQGRRPDYALPLDDPWPLVAASPLSWKEGGIVASKLTIEGMERAISDFVSAAKRADAAGFDMLEIQAGHGFLLGSFISPILNHRDDAYGGVLANRLRFPLEVISAVRDVWPEEKPMCVRISAHDWMGESGIQPHDAVAIACALKSVGIDLIDVSSGETSPKAQPVYGRLFQTPLADRIRNEVKIPVVAVGNITEADQANSIIMAGRADLVAIGRPHLVDPAWTARAAAEAQLRDFAVHNAYSTGQAQLRGIFNKKQMLEEAMRA